MNDLTIHGVIEVTRKIRKYKTYSVTEFSIKTNSGNDISVNLFSENKNIIFKNEKRK